MKIIFAATPDISIPCLEEILNSPNISQRSNERISNILKTFKKK